jgi:GST-like protein
MLGQVHHFNHYAPVKIDYAIERYVNEASRLYGVLDTQLSKGDYVTGDDYTIADMAILPWTKSYARQGIDLAKFPNIARWRETLHNRKAVQKAYEIGEKNKTDLRELSGEEWQKLFGTTKPK